MAPWIGLSPVFTADGPLVVAAIHDLRPQRRGEGLLRDAKAAAERANQAKSRFLAAASHDLRQPLQTIELLRGVLETRVADPESRTALLQLDDAVAQMAELLDSLLEINRLETGEITPDITDFPVAPVLARASETLTPIAASKRLRLRYVPCSSVIRSDRVLLARIGGNLLTNAIKYTDRGKILLGCRRRGDSLRIEVWDTGIGIAADQLDSIFDEFYRVDRQDAGRSGSGLDCIPSSASRSCSVTRLRCDPRLAKGRSSPWWSRWEMTPRRSRFRISPPPPMTRRDPRSCWSRMIGASAMLWACCSSWKAIASWRQRQAMRR